MIKSCQAACTSCWIMQIRIFQPATIFATRLSGKYTCDRIRTSSNNNSTKQFNSVVACQKETKGCWRGFLSCGGVGVERTSGESGATPIFTPTGLSSENNNNRMPIVAAVAAHRRIYPATTSTSGSGSASRTNRSSCAVKFSALSILTPPLGAAGLSSVCKTASSKYSACYTGASGNCRPIFDLKHLGAFLQGSTSGVLAESRRYYAKGKDKPKTKKTQVAINESEMAEVIDVENFKSQLAKLLEQMKEEFTNQLSIRGAAGALETIQVEFDGEVYPLQELAQVGRKNPQLAVLNMASLPDAIQPVLKAVNESGMNLNCQQEGTTIYVPLPKVTREHRENLAKNAKALFMKYKTSMQGVQNKFVKQCKSQKELSEDLVFSVQQQIMKLTESYITEAEQCMFVKQKELLENK